MLFFPVFSKTPAFCLAFIVVLSFWEIWSHSPRFSDLRPPNHRWSPCTVDSSLIFHKPEAVIRKMQRSLSWFLLRDRPPFGFRNGKSLSTAVPTAVAQFITSISQKMGPSANVLRKKKRKNCILAWAGRIIDDYEDAAVGGKEGERRRKGERVRNFMEDEMASFFGIVFCAFLRDFHPELWRNQCSIDGSDLRTGKKDVEKLNYRVALLKDFLWKFSKKTWNWNSLLITLWMKNCEFVLIW